LGLVVRRDKEIENFVSKPYYVLVCTLNLSGNRKISGRRKITESSDIISLNTGLSDAAPFESMEQLVSKEVCKLLCDIIRGKGEITGVDKKVHRKTPPLPYSLPKLQIDASRLYDVTDTLVHVQRLYEGGYLSYPRTDCPYIPEGHHAQARLVLDAIASACPDLRDLLIGVDVSRKSPAWNDSGQEHHAIIPTVKVPLEGALSDIERKIYDLAARRYALQFLPDCEYEETAIEFSAGGEIFKTFGRTVLVPGWTRWDKEEAKDQEGDGDFSILPSVSVGETGEAEPAIEEKKTAPPKRFTYDTLLGAMNNIYLYVQEPAIRKQLKELGGIGTAATQESILALLFERGYIEKRKTDFFHSCGARSHRAFERGEKRGVRHSRLDRVMGARNDFYRKWRAFTRSLCRQGGGYGERNRGRALGSGQNPGNIRASQKKTVFDGRLQRIPGPKNRSLRPFFLLPGLQARLPGAGRRADAWKHIWRSHRGGLPSGLREESAAFRREVRSFLEMFLFTACEIQRR
jgi:DNA topoisomerase IA